MLLLKGASGTGSAPTPAPSIDQELAQLVGRQSKAFQVACHNSAIAGMFPCQQQTS